MLRKSGLKPFYALTSIQLAVDRINHTGSCRGLKLSTAQIIPSAQCQMPNALSADSDSDNG